MSYKFLNPGIIRIRQRTPDHNNMVDVSGEKWYWTDGGQDFHMDWNKFNFQDPLKEIFKAFFVNRLMKIAPLSVSQQYGTLINKIHKSNLVNAFPWDRLNVLSFLGAFVSSFEAQYIYAFRNLYRWGFQQNIEGFSKEVLLVVEEHKTAKSKSYEKVFLSQSYMTSEEEHLILKHITIDLEHADYHQLFNNVLLHLCFELAPRPIQLHMLDIGDFNVVTSPSGNSYYSLNLPMAKKRSTDGIEKRSRSISEQLGKKILQLVESTDLKLSNSLSPLFKLRPNSKVRIPKNLIGNIVSQQLASLGIKTKSAATLLRHHLAQSLADQGASAETIAEILGHNSTLPARAYIAATPKIAEIKTRALGKNHTYQDIMKMLLTGEIIDRKGMSNERFVKGMIGGQYIGGIGECGLPSNTACPKNPVYSCYTCHKFHPFQDGQHQEVKLQLQRQVQTFIDTAEKSMQLESNRTVLQLEKTIEAVDSVIQRINDLNVSIN